MAKFAFAVLTAFAVAAAAPALAQPTGAPPPSAPMPPPPPQAPPPLPPAPPPTGVSADILRVIDQACLPLIRAPGTDPKSVAKPLKLKDTRDGWQLKSGGVNKLNIRLPNSANPSSCEIIAQYDPGQGPAIIAALATWGAAQPAPLQPVRNAEQIPGVDPTHTYTNTNWVGWSASTRMGLSFLEEKGPGGVPAGKNADQAVVQFSFRAITAQDAVAQ